LSCEDNVTKECHISNDWCKHTGFEVSKDGQFSKEIIEIDEDCNPIYDDENFSEEDSFELLQQKNFINALLDGRQVQCVDQRNKVEPKNCDIRRGKCDVSFVSTKENRSVADHYDDMLERFQKEIELLEYLLKEPEYETRIAIREKECSEMTDNEDIFKLMTGTKEDCFQNNDFSTDT